MRLRSSIFLVLFALSGCKPAEHKAPPPVDVTDFVVEERNIPAVFDFIGFAESTHPVEIRARVEGYLDTIAYQEGQIVKVGDLLFQLDPRQYEALVEQAKGDVDRQQAILENAKLTVDRLAPLYQQKAASKKDLDNALANQLAAQATLASLNAKLLDAEINLGYTTIRSPITGLADKSKLRQGALINPGTNSLLTTVSVVDPIWVYFSVSDNDIMRARQQEISKKIILPAEKAYQVELTLGTGEVYPIKGRVDFSAPTYDQSTGTLLVRAVFENPEIVLRPGQFVRVKVYGATRPNAIAVPQRALMQKKNGMFVYLIDKDNKVISQDVSAGEWEDDFQVITNGLKPGDRIVVDGINKIRAGTDIHVTGPWKPLPKPTNTSSP
ncbi:MAG: efflux RND transporter periplasmic adaptor subunit [Parachlamydiaceae bacterium]|nr:efflux RND transporter periplasmic adaptor subunit [Parachlamydiaceae bacterium]